MSISKDEEPGSFYLPHHAVLKESSQTTKCRIVFDGSCQLKEGLPVNQTQYTGPTLQDDLVSIITRFRTHRYVLTRDITQMSRQVIVHPADRKIQKILWRKEPDAPLQTFEMNRVTFGMTSASFLAVRCILQLGKDAQAKHPEEAEIIENDFYIDDLITGHDDKIATGRH